MTRNIVLCTISLFFMVSLSLVAQVPRVMNYQGQMTNPSGQPLDTTVQMVFRIYDDSIEGNMIWSETHPDVSVVNGQFIALIGSIDSLSNYIFDSPDRFLGVTIGSDSEINPRTKLAAVPYSQRVSTIDGTTGGVITGSMTIQAGTGGKDDIAGDLNVAGKATIGSGHINTGNFSFVAGSNNDVAGGNSTVGGGNDNTVTGNYSIISGGQHNTSNWNWSAVGGGRYNSALSEEATVSGGRNNSAEGRGFVGGGSYNSVGSWSAVPGGSYNTALGLNSFIGGGDSNSISGMYSAISGGKGDTISSDYSYLFGIRSKLTQDSTFMVDMPHIRFGDEATGYEFPNEDGTNGQVLVTNGGGQLNWATSSGGGGGWFDDGTNVRLESETDKVAIGTSTPSMYPLTVKDGIIVSDATGNYKTRLHTQNDVGWIMTYGSNGSVNSQISSQVGAGDFGRFTLHNDVGESRVSIKAESDGNGSISLAGLNGQAGMVYLGADYQNPNLGLIEVGGKAGIYETETGTGVVKGELVEATVEGFKFPDGSVQTTAATDPANSGWVDDGNYIRMEAIEDSVGIGTATPSEKLEVDGNIVVSGKATIGQDNFSNPGYSFVTGVLDTAYGTWNVISGGYDNKTNGMASAVGGGYLNEATGAYSSTIAGGERNTASNNYSTVGGGVNNTADGSRSTVPGGEFNSAAGDHSFAAGHRARANHNGAFVWADQEDSYFTSTAADQFLIRAAGGVGIGTTSPTEELEVAGTVYSTSGGFKFPDGTTQTTAATAPVNSGWIDEGTTVRLTYPGDHVIAGLGDSTIHIGNNGVRIGRNLNPSPYTLLSLTRYYHSTINTTHYGLDINVEEGAIGTIYGIKCSATNSLVGGHSTYGIYGTASGGNAAYGLYGYGHGPAGTNYGIYATCGSSLGNYGGYFYGNLLATGSNTKGGGGYKIDHPLDPENRYLSHSDVSSPDMMNIYNGNVTTDESGMAVVVLPEYFEALNADFRYQLTPIGASAPDLYVAEKISGNRFVISGGKPFMEVSWQVTGVRQDNFAKAAVIATEELKSDEEKGMYMHPEVLGFDVSKSVDYKHHRILEEKEILEEEVYNNE